MHVSKPSTSRSLLVAACMGLSVFNWVPAEAAAIHALVIGINDYKHPTEKMMPLHGAVDDANDVADAIRSLGAKNVTVLLNGNADRDSIFNAWDRIVASAKEGDTVFLTYAGHGGQEKERIVGSTANGMVQTTLLADFSERPPHNYQRIFDFEWHAKIKAAKGLDVITLFDSCHSGSATRSAVKDSIPQQSRNAVYGAIPADEDMLIEVDIKPAPSVASNETYVGGTLDGELVYEIPIAGKPRGAASYYFARALSGHADIDQDGQLTRGELKSYITENVRIATASRQTATVEFPTDVPASASLLDITRPAPPLQDNIEIAFAISGVADDQVRALSAGLKGARIVDERSAQLLWKVDQGVVVDRFGADVVATKIPTAERFQKVLDRWSVFARLKLLAERRPVKIRLAEGDGLYRGGTVTAIVEEFSPYTHLLLYNLASDGTIQYVAKNQQATCCMLDFTLANIPIIAPYGADHLFVVATRAEVPALENKLRQINSKVEPSRFYEVLKAQAETGDLRLGFVGFYTEAPRGG